MWLDVTTVSAGGETLNNALSWPLGATLDCKTFTFSQFTFSLARLVSVTAQGLHIKHDGGSHAKDSIAWRLRG
jgi:hypothetical protein